MTPVHDPLAPVTAPGLSVTLGEQQQPAGVTFHYGSPVTTGVVSGVASFDSIKHLLSNKPIARPNRKLPRPGERSK